MFKGGPVPIYPSVRPRPRKDVLAGRLPAVPPADDKEWRALVMCGGAGDRADTAQEQRARYPPPKSREFSPGLFIHRGNPDIVAVAGMDYTVRTFDAKDNFRPLQIFEGHFMQVNAVESYRGKWLVSAGDDCSVRKWRLGTEEYGECVLTVWTCPFALKAICQLPGHRIACGGLEKSVRIISMATGTLLHVLWGHRDEPEDSFLRHQGCGSVYTLLHLRGNLLVSGADDSSIRFWDVDTAKCLGIHVGHHGYGADIGSANARQFELTTTFAPVWRVCHLSGDGDMIASGSYDRTVCIWDTRNVFDVKVVRRILAADNAIMCLCALGTRHLATGGCDMEVKVWDWQTGELESKTKTRGFACGLAELSKNTLIIGGGDATLRVFDWEKEVDVLPEEVFGSEYIINNICLVFNEDRDESLWVRNPILYRSATKEDQEEDSHQALCMFREVLTRAMAFRDVNKFGQLSMGQNRLPG